MISVYDPAGLETVRRQLKLDPLLVTRLRGRLFRSFEGDGAGLAGLDEKVRKAVSAAIRFRELDLVSVRHSRHDGATKLLFRTSQGELIESVILRITTGRSSLCVSSQTGCAGGCLFCATGRLKGGRNLSPAEILDQVVQAGEQLHSEGRRLRNVVFMGMGEPLLNEANLFAALDQLSSSRGFHLSPRHLLVSTLGIPDGIRRLSRSYPGVGLAVSLHTVRQEVRDRLMPLTRRWPLPSLREAIRERNRDQGQPVMVEVLMLDGVTDTPADCRALTEWMRGLQVHVNLIPYNSSLDTDHAPACGGLPLRASPEARVREVLAELKGAGFKATRRHSLGADIQAACGQLAEAMRAPAP